MTVIPPPMCMSCIHLGTGLTCKAFPRGIPEAIWASRHDHRTPLPGDKGVQFEQDPGKPPFRFDLYIYSE